jgi:hypothetical protein
MTKPFRGFVPKANKGELVVAAKEQVQGKEESTVGTATAPQAEATPPLATLDAKVSEALKGANEQGPPPPPPAPKVKNETGLYALGKKYAPKTDRNSETWGKITKALGEGPKTLKELSEAVKGHGDFIGYMTRGGHIVPYIPQEANA